jgi:hypothetical protein
VGKVSKGVECSVEGCGKEATRSLPLEKVTAAGLKAQGTRRVYLCRDHYKEYKKATKKEKMLDKWRYRDRIS